MAHGSARQCTRACEKDHLDKFIAAHAPASGNPLVTNNVSDFMHYPGLVIEN